jgi:hypothetical protein
MIGLNIVIRAGGLERLYRGVLVHGFSAKQLSETLRFPPSFTVDYVGLIANSDVFFTSNWLSPFSKRKLQKNRLNYNNFP